MADEYSAQLQLLPLTPESIKEAHGIIKKYIHRTPLLTSKTLNSIIGTPTSEGKKAPKIRVYLKCENFQKIGAFKARGAHHALLRLIDRLGIDEVKKRGVVTHSSGNHAQALALAARTFEVPSYIVMPTISTPSKIKGTQAYSDNVIFSGSTSQEREAVVVEVIAKTGAILIPPYDHEHIMLGQGTCAYEMEEQYKELQSESADQATPNGSTSNNARKHKSGLDLVLSPLGGGGLLSGICIYFSDKPNTRVFGCEPSYQGCDDGKRGLEANPPTRITSVKSLTIADGLRTPVGEKPWKIFTSGSDRKNKYLQGVRNATEDQIKQAMRLLLERVKIFVEPSSCVGLAALLFDEEFRDWIVQEQGDEIWDVGLVLTGGNTTIEAIISMFAESKQTSGGEEATSTSGSGSSSGGAGQTNELQREEGKIGFDGSKMVQNVAG